MLEENKSGSGELHWSEDPEKEYFREMLEERKGSGGIEVDSVLGNTTINELYDLNEEKNAEESSLGSRAFNDEDSLGFSVHQEMLLEEFSRKSSAPKKDPLSLVGTVKSDDDSFGYSVQQPSTADDDSYGYTADPNAPLRLAVLGPEDDLSTIAGDTISGQTIGTEGAVFSNANLAGVSNGTNQPVQRDFKEYGLRTPTKQKKRRWNPYFGRSDDDDENTQPETPQSGKSGEASRNGESEKDGSTYFTYTGPSKRVYICAAAMGLILIISICGLAIAYSKVSDESSTSEVQAEVPPSGGFNPEDFAPTIIPAPTDAPVEAAGETAAPVAVEEEEVIPAPTRTPITLPTKAPVPVPETALENLNAVLVENGIDVTAFQDDPNAPQRRSTEWLAADPNYDDYTESRLIQRWSLGVVAYSLSLDDKGINSAGDFLPGWLDYDTGECEWFSTLTGNQCNGFGFYEVLDLQDQQFYGTLPSEIFMLSSLRFLDLRGNKIRGSIPPSISRLENLERLQLTNNEISGPFPVALTTLPNVAVIGLDRNQMTGTIPAEIGNMSRLTTLGLEQNNFSGPIPAELGTLENLSFVTLAQNDLFGEIPEAMCASREINNLSADCHLVECECCTECGPTDQPTGAPTKDTVEPTAEPTLRPTPQPTDEPTDDPTASPTGCVNPVVDWNFDECMETGGPLFVEFRNCNPENGDWIGIYNKDADPENLGDPILWSWTCGTQNCRGSPTSNTIVFDENDLDDIGGDWPLRKGDYYAYLVRNSGSPFQAIAESEKLKLKDNDC